MHKLVYLLFAALIAVFIYMVTMPLLMLYEDQAEEVEEVTYYMPQEGLEAHYHKEVEMAKGRKARRAEAQQEKSAEAEMQNAIESGATSD